MSDGTLYGVGLGPGDPELVTVKAARLVGAADVVAYHCARHGRSVRPVQSPSPTCGRARSKSSLSTRSPPRSATIRAATTARWRSYYAAAADRLMAHLAAGRDVVLLAEGDPLFYSSYMHMHKRISSRFRTEIVPGVTSVSAAAAALAMPLVEGGRRAHRAAGHPRAGGN